MKRTIAALSGLILAGSVASTAISQEQIDKNLQSAITARESLMHLFAFNVGLLGAMAKGEVPYDAAAAEKAATDIVLLSKHDQSRLWPKGSDNFALGEKATRAKPDIWDKPDEFATKYQALVDGAAAMETAAGGGLDSLKGGMAALGGSCGGCHKAFRQSRD
ncbi:c-type cytochrome [Aquicoccus sp. G2-2]|uniref:c-type cytochrome n=1 Tax=Aquicoccus sp. G2-2 TaxID=3092120 RepID=UPI002ADF3F28|nr:cytochrome c [Aquicoccus sp. G2-2]MEA1113167.1 cytochrome c [Aquicoccus sp. G2-2]